MTKFIKKTSKDFPISDLHNRILLYRILRNHYGAKRVVPVLFLGHIYLEKLYLASFLESFLENLILGEIQ